MVFALTLEKTRKATDGLGQLSYRYATESKTSTGSNKVRGGSRGSLAASCSDCRWV